MHPAIIPLLVVLAGPAPSAPAPGAPAPGSTAPSAPPNAETPAAAPEVVTGNTVVIKKLSVARYAHSLAADQYKSPGEHALPNAFDGDPATIWYVPAPALSEPGYTVEVSLAAPVQVDQLRIVVDPSPGPLGRAARFSSVELNFWDRSLSTTFPIYKRMLSIPIDRPAADLAVPNPAKWNAQLINDDGFGDKRRSRGFGDTIPLPLTIDALTIVVQETTPGVSPATVADVLFMLHGVTLQVARMDEVKSRHRVFIETGLKHIVEGRYFVGPTRTLHFGYSGAVSEISAADWAAGRAEGKSRKKLGSWRIEGARLEFAAGKKFEPVDYALDEAPTRVMFRTPPVAGEYSVATRAPNAPPAPGSEAAPLPPTLGNTPGYEPPPLIE